MQVSEVQSGRKLTLEIQNLDETVFDAKETLKVKNEVTLSQSELTGEILMRHGQDAWAIKGIESKEQNKLVEIIERNLPRLCWITAIKPNHDQPEKIYLQIHEFPSGLYLPKEKLEIGIDEKIIDDIRDRHIRRADPIDKIIDWLSKKILLPSLNNEQGKRALLQDNYQKNFQNSFRIWGNGIVINIRGTPDDKFLIDRIEKATQPQNISQQRPVILLEADICFCDASIAGSVRGQIQIQLDYIVKTPASYLALWQQYNEIEQKIIYSKAQEFGWLRYENQQMLNNGNYRFKLIKSNNLKNQLQFLKEDSFVTIEVSKNQPEFNFESEEDSGFIEIEKQTKARNFCGEFVAVNLEKLTIDLRNSNLEDEQFIIPEKGYLFISLIGDKTRLDRRKKAQSLILTPINPQNPMPQLGLLLENQAVLKRRTKKLKPITAQVKKLFNNLPPTARQEEAIKIALNTPDIALIQGPPGTGKTKVITAIQARLAQEAEDQNRSVNHRILLTSYQHDAVENAAERTVLFQLPAVRIGGKRNKDHEFNNIDLWRRQRIENLEATLANLPQLPAQTILKKVRNLTATYQFTPGTSAETAKLLRNIYDFTQGYISQELSDKLLELSQQYKQNLANFNQENNEDLELVLKAVKAIRITPASFSDDGNITALKVLKRLQPLNILTSEEINLLTEAGDYFEDQIPPFLEQLANLQTDLLNRLIPKETTPVTKAIANEEILNLFSRVRLSLDDYIRRSPDGIEAVLSEYLEDLKNDPEAVAKTIKKYTVVLAATCQQSDGKEMKFVTENPNHVFETVIVDEAARANPLDLFIPMAKAERRIILVGDHRQLPHILEEDVERQLSKSTSTTQDRLQKSLFERLFNQLKELEKKDGIKRTVTLDTQYRMHPILGDFVSQNFYECHGEPKINSGRKETDFIHNLPRYENSVCAWINAPFSLGGEMQGQSKSRSIEAKIIAKELKRIIDYNQNLTFGIITFYSAQVTKIWKALENEGIAEKNDDSYYQIIPQYQETRNNEDKIVERLRIGTVDAFQGKEFDVVFLSLTRSNDLEVNNEKMARQKYGFLMLENRLCVAMSRQQRLLITVGDLDMINNKYAPTAIPQLVKFYQLCQSENGKIYKIK